MQSIQSLLDKPLRNDPLNVSIEVRRTPGPLIDFPVLPVVLLCQQLEKAAEDAGVGTWRQPDGVNGAAQQAIFRPNGWDDQTGSDDSAAVRLAVGQEIDRLHFHFQGSPERIVSDGVAADRQGSIMAFGQSFGEPMG